MSTPISYHSLCRWTFNAGKGGFTPGNIRPSWGADVFTTVDFIRLVRHEIAPRLPSHIKLGVELHYDYEVNEKNVDQVTEALLENNLHLAMITPGAHQHFGFGGICSLDEKERRAAEDFGKKTVDLVYGKLKKTWLEDCPPTFVIWNGSWGYDVASIAVYQMYQNLKESIAELCRYEQQLGGLLFWGLEPKPNEGHPAMLIPTVASALLFWHRIADDFDLDITQMGVNKEFGHSEMIGLDHVYDTVEELDNQAMTHVHLNSQGYNDGLLTGGPGKFDIDFGVRINGMNITIAHLMRMAEYKRWKGHDMQPRPYDSVSQALDRVLRAILSWEACEYAASQLDVEALFRAYQNRNTAQVEDIMNEALIIAHKDFKRLYRG